MGRLRRASIFGQKKAAFALCLMGLARAAVAQEAGAGAGAETEATPPAFQLACAFERAAGGPQGMGLLDEPNSGAVITSVRRPSRLVLVDEVLIELPSPNGVRRFVVSLPRGNILTQLVTVLPGGGALRSQHIITDEGGIFTLAETGRCEVRE